MHHSDNNPVDIRYGFLMVFAAIFFLPALVLPAWVGAQDLKWSNTDPLVDIPDFAGPDKGFFPVADYSGNTVTVPDGSTVDGTVAGGISADQNVIGNKVIVTGSTVAGSVLGAGTEKGNAYDNSVTVTDSAVGAGVTGGYTGAGAAYNNSVTVTSGQANSSPDTPADTPADTPTETTPETTPDAPAASPTATATADENGSGTTTGQSDITGNINGGYSVKGNVYNNTVRITLSKVSGGINGGYTKEGNVYNNTVAIDGGTVKDISGGTTGKGDAYNNSVNIRSGTITGFITGGKAGENADDQAISNATGNSVNISGAESILTADVAGGQVSGAGSASNNSVNVSEGTGINGRIAGGYSDGAGDATGNTVNISGAGTNVTGSVYGGYSERGTVANNTVTVNDADSAVTGNIAGGRAEANDATGNSVVINGGTVTSSEAAGGSAHGAGNARGNSVTVNAGSINATIYGGAAFDSGSAAGNTVNIRGGALAEKVTGGFASGSGHATDNTVNISGGETKNEVRGGYALGSGNSSGNTVNISNGSVAGNVFGGATLGSGNATGNLVLLSYGSVIGDVLGGVSQAGNVTGNSVTISDGSVTGNVYGGLAQSTSATGNTVTVSGGSVHGTIYGSYVNTNGGKATGNTVILAGKPTLAEAQIKGGEINGNGDKFSGNTLVLREYTGGPVGQVSNFENYDITLPATIHNGDVALEVESIAFGNGADKKSVLRSLSFQGGGTALEKGASVALFRKSDGSAVDTTNLELAEDIAGALQGRKGISLIYEYALTDALSGYTATVSDVHTNPQVKSLSEGHLAGLAFANQGQDLLVTEGVRNAVSATREGQGLSSFAAVSYGTSRYDTGSHVDVDGGSMLAGLAWGSGMRSGRLTLGALFEAGMGSYDAHNSFNGYSSVKADGDTNYIGGGILGRFDFANSGPGHFYTEITGRIGRLESDFSSDDLRDSTGVKADYDSSGLYYGAHFGAGYIVNITNKASLDLYGKYLWTHQKGDSITLSNGDPIKFEDASSHRLRGGARLSYAASYRVSPYIGAAYEQEFDGEAKAKTYGQKIDAPKLQGGTGIGEIGLNIRPATGIPLSFDLGVQGYLGVRKGLGGSLQLKYDF